MAVKKTTQVKIRCTGSELESMLTSHNHTLENVKVPHHAEIVVVVPSGGDYSGMKIPLEDLDVEIEWSNEEFEGDWE